jgi:hypothetical protein
MAAVKTKDTNGPGAAAVHLVCADLLLSGFRAFVAAEGLHYDVVMDCSGRLIRIQVKGSGLKTGRSGRGKSTSPVRYQFLTSRNHRPDRVGRASKIKRYDATIIDMLALVALDSREIGYLAVTGVAPHVVHLFPSGTARFKRGEKLQRRTFSDLNLTGALAALELP